MMLAAAIVAAFGLAGCNSNRAPDNGGTNSHHTETRATGGNTKTTGRVCQLLQDDNPNRSGRKVVYRCNGRAVLASDEAKRLLNPSVPVSFGGSGSVVQSNLITRQAANLNQQLYQAVTSETPELVKDILDYNLKNVLTELKYDVKYNNK